jgi:hypothetical protein
MNQKKCLVLFFTTRNLIRVGTRNCNIFFIFFLIIRGVKMLNTALGVSLCRLPFEPDLVLTLLTL